MKHREALKFITIHPQVLDLNILWGRKNQKCCHLGHHGFVWLEGHIFLTTCPIRLKFDVWTDLSQAWALAKFQSNRMKNGGDRGVFHVTFTCFIRRSKGCRYDLHTHTTTQKFRKRHLHFFHSLFPWASISVLMPDMACLQVAFYAFYTSSCAKYWLIHHNRISMRI